MRTIDTIADSTSVDPSRSAVWCSRSNCVTTT